MAEQVARLTDAEVNLHVKEILKEGNAVIASDPKEGLDGGRVSKIIVSGNLPKLYVDFAQKTDIKYHKAILRHNNSDISQISVTDSSPKNRGRVVMKVHILNNRNHDFVAEVSKTEFYDASKNRYLVNLNVKPLTKV